jgi:hypothetical protein
VRAYCCGFLSPDSASFCIHASFSHARPRAEGDGLRAGKSLLTMPQFVVGIMDRIGLMFTHLNYLAKGNSLSV